MTLELLDPQGQPLGVAVVQGGYYVDTEIDERTGATVIASDNQPPKRIGSTTRMPYSSRPIARSAARIEGASNIDSDSFTLECGHHQRDHILPPQLVPWVLCCWLQHTKGSH